MYKRSIFFYSITIFFSIYVLFALLNSNYVYEKKTSGNILTIIASNSIKDECLNSNNNNKYDYAKLYAQYLNDCQTKRSYQTDEIVRAVLFYFPIEHADTFEPELKWMYQSWLEMLGHEPSEWRTDLILFVRKFNQSHEFNFFSKLNCSFLNVRTSKQDKSMCTLIEYEPLANRQVVLSNTDDVSFDYLYGSFNIFEPSQFDLVNFNAKLKSDLGHYSYTDSILIAFDGYEYLKSKYDYVIRSDLDIFLTPGFAKWTPNTCGDFNVGRGGYSTRFNMKRLNRVAHFMGLKYNFTANLGSTWYSTPENFRLVSYLTLVSMAYLSNEEFSKTEREGKLGARLWPDWHYGVLLLYGQNIALNHLIKTNSMQVVKLDNLMDVSSSSTTISIYDVIHIHVYHDEKLFSKFEFKKNKYENRTSIPDDKKDFVNYYSLRIALKSLKLGT